MTENERIGIAYLELADGTRIDGVTRAFEDISFSKEPIRMFKVGIVTESLNGDDFVRMYQKGLFEKFKVVAIENGHVMDTGNLTKLNKISRQMEGRTGREYLLSFVKQEE